MAARINPSTHRVGVSAVIFNDLGQVLVSRRVDNGWFQPARWRRPNHMSRSPKG